MRAKDQLGKAGEDLAVRHLVGAGFTIVERNWRCNEGELDVVAVDRDTLVVVEVKTRTSTDFGLPAEAVTWRKSAKLRELAARWVREHACRMPVRIDVISIVMPRSGRTQLQHYRGVL
ncbi:MAG TPA: YraN family protein [Mycobacteriales bacterium]|jgi:putative endonuclease|nr:YraN family protein [Mycobacteriales bacterium]